MENYQLKKYYKRKKINYVMLFLALVSMSFGVLWLVWILFDTLYFGLRHINLAIFTENLPPPSALSGGGLANAIYGSVLMVALGTFIGTILGIMTGIYLNEYGQNNLLSSLVRFFNDILLSAPSIIIGLFVYTWFVIPFNGFSGWAGVIALSLIVLPIVVRTTENMLQLIPNTLREAAYALGTPKWKVMFSIILRAARAGILTGFLLAIARVSGETAPLLFTSMSNQFWNGNLSEPMASLPIVIFQFAMSPFENWRNLAWVGVLIITITVLLLNILSKFFINKRRA